MMRSARVCVCEYVCVYVRACFLFMVLLADERWLIYKWGKVVSPSSEGFDGGVS